MRRLTAALPLLALALAACEESVGCPPIAGDGVRTSAGVVPGGGPRRLSQVPAASVYVTAVDSETGRNLSDGATGSFVTGTFADSLRHELPTLLTGYGPPARYSLVVQHAGYAPWGSGDVRVTENGCGLQPAEVTARLRPAGAQ